eukprot:scaffold106441_cov23-Tisochrysis_lutea.AAC.3
MTWGEKACSCSDPRAFCTHVVELLFVATQAGHTVYDRFPVDQLNTSNTHLHPSGPWRTRAWLPWTALSTVVVAGQLARRTKTNMCHEVVP